MKQVLKISTVSLISFASAQYGTIEVKILVGSVLLALFAVSFGFYLFEE